MCQQEYLRIHAVSTVGQAYHQHSPCEAVQQTRGPSHCSARKQACGQRSRVSWKQSHSCACVIPRATRANRAHPMAEFSSSVVPRASKTRSPFGLLSPVKVLEKPLRSARVGGRQPCRAPCSPLPAQPYLHLPFSCRSWGCGSCEGLAQGCRETRGVRGARTPRGKRHRGAGVCRPRGGAERRPGAPRLRREHSAAGRPRATEP